MITYIQIFVLSLIICADSPSAQSRTSISVTVGSTAVLPCDWRNSTQSSSQSPHVEWCTFAGTVFERRGGEVYQGEGYEDRVDVPEDHLLKGDCSLELKDVRPEDAGFYESYLLVRRTKTLISKRVFLQSVELSVEDASEDTNSGKKAAERNAGTIQTSSQIMFILLPCIFFHFN
uniref:Immunoglobulin V-set domain-containing protein n=1 Tax=Pygocentrus nattereri TaxID=42514 RepID=A0A3B4D367_PYGNA